MSIGVLLILSVVFFLIELLYFKVAERFNIVDRPNNRSSHASITIRGGGIVFCLSLFIWGIYSGLKIEFFLFGLMLISLISFIDDMKTVSNRMRLIVHLIAVVLMFYQVNMYQIPYYLIIVSFIFAIGTINAVNFMDGINGITGAYSLLTIFVLYFINSNVTAFIDGSYLVVVILSLLAFNFFNFRIKAKCFAGDVGSVSIAYIIIFFMLLLMVKTKSFSCLLLLLVYGLDVVTTIFFRLCRRENVFQPHRAHFYQFLANERKVPHLIVAIIYVCVQGLIDLFVVRFKNLSLFKIFITIFIAALIFIGIRVYFEGRKKLFSMR